LSYPTLRRDVAAAGLLHRSPWNYLDLFLITAALGVVAIAIVGWAPGAWRFAAIPFLSLCWMQLGFLGHEAGHNAVFEQTKRNQLLGYLCFPILLGMSFRPWVIRHNLHHAETNVEETDPDLENKLVAFTDAAAREKTGLHKWIVRWQAFLFPFIATLATIGFRIDAWRYVTTEDGLIYATRKYARERRWELVMLTANAVLWLVLPTLLLGPWHWFSVLIPAQMLFGIHMVSAFAPNHKGMEMYDAEKMPTFLEAQVLTSRNVRPNWFVDFMYGGLNYQIEHHLFPTMARRHLGKARQIVIAHCAKTGVNYTEESFVESWRAIFGELNRIGQLAGQRLPANDSRQPLAA
jgi:fatty acid desaturase